MQVDVLIVLTFTIGNVYLTLEFHDRFHRGMVEFSTAYGPSYDAVEDSPATMRRLAAIDRYGNVHTGEETRGEVVLNISLPSNTARDDPAGFTLGGDIHFQIYIGVRPVRRDWLLSPKRVSLTESVVDGKHVGALGEEEVRRLPLGGTSVRGERRKR